VRREIWLSGRARSLHLKCDYYTGRVYYIIFTLIDLDNTEYIQKKYVENINDIGDVDRYYYYRKNDESDDNHGNCDNSEYITNDNSELFMWCITKC
jgi:hypothetical protein